ncbi:uncharacterized protein isoform X1 [Takifugu rubripes]|uniref:Uncharacterized LOC115252578 n=1 Tax=Takifugu rubripes TaxID=31033 RepID=A0A674NQW8_TAKRU|nr:uncharacterized protein LOC115252578 isoform X1 [Takifugu rubripes]
MQSTNAQMLIPNLFPAKLWNLVNHPEVTAIVWDSKGECIEINQELLEKQILSPSTNTLTGCPSFKSISFSSFIRQLYAYGFKKAEHCKRYLVIHHYLHPLFKKNKPELLSLMGRLATKTRRPPPYFPEILLEKGNDNVDAHPGGDNVEGARMHTGNHLLQHQFNLIPVAPHAVTAVHPQFPGRNDGIGACVPNVLHVPVANYPGAIIPSMIHPLCFLQRPPMLPPPDCYVRWGYQQNHMTPMFVNPYKMGYPVNTYGAPQPANVAPQNAQMRKSPSLIIIEDESQDSFSGGESLPVPSVYSHDNTPTKSGEDEIPTLAPEESSKDSTEKAAELLLFLSGKGCHRS